jgi:drug/metabolite transporter (DMT)-like permease
MDPKRIYGISAMVAAVLLFSITSSVVKSTDAPGSVLAMWRMFMAIGAWWTVVLVMNARTGAGLPSRQTWIRCTPAGLLFGANLALFFTAIKATSIANAEFIGSLSPLALVPAGALLFGERPDWRALRWGAISLIGIALVLFGGAATDTATASGNALMVGVVSLWIGYLLATKMARRSDISTVHFMACAVPIAALSATPLTLVLDGGEVWPLSGSDWAVVVLLALSTGVGAHGLVVFAQRHLPVATIGILQVGQPALAAFWAWLLLGETVTSVQIPGMLLVIVGLSAFTMVSQRRAVLPIAVPPPSIAERDDWPDRLEPPTEPPAESLDSDPQVRR